MRSWTIRVDEALGGFCDKINVTIHLDNSITVEDNGRGIPVDIHPTEKRPAAEVVMTVLHAGGKFDSNAYKVSGGLHGVGASVVNFLSEWMRMEIRRDGGVYEQEYKKGFKATDLKKTGKSAKTGTKITFKPDPEIFTTTDFSFDKLSERLREKAFLNKGIRITIIDERSETEKKHEFLYEGGIAEFVKHLNKNKNVLHSKPMYFEKAANSAEGDDLAIEVAIQYNDAYDEKVFAFANNINTVDGGTHLSGFRSALSKAISRYAQTANLIKDFKGGLTGDDVREGLVAVISVKMPQPQFEGQTKGKLNSDVKGPVDSFIYDKLMNYFEQNPSVAKQIVGKAVEAARAREAARKGPRDRPQGRAQFDEPARQTRRLLGERPGSVRVVYRRRRFSRGERKTRPRPPHAGDPAAQGQDPQRREGALRQDALAQRDQDADHRARHRHRQRRFRRREAALSQNYSDD